MPELKPEYRDLLKTDRALRLKAALKLKCGESTIRLWVDTNSIQLTQDRMRAFLAKELDVHPDSLIEFEPELKRLLKKEKYESR